MFSNNQSNVKEHFIVSGGNTTNISDSVKVKKSFENNQRINRSMTVESLSKIFNNIASDVIQKNSATAAAAVGASNTIFISGVKCETVRITGNKQVSSAQLDVQIKTQQANTSKVSTEITTSINKTIEKVGSTDLAALQADNTKQLNDYMSAMPGYDPNKAQKLASKCPSGGGLFSISNTCNVSTSYELDGSVKQALDLDESFKITDNDDISNDIKNKIEQSNFASCQSNATAQNAIIIQDIICTVNNAAVGAERASQRGGTFEFEDNEQIAIAKLFMTCIFDQKSVNEIANKIMNTIAKRYNQIYDAIEKKALTKGPEYYKKASELVDLLAAAGTEQIQAAAGNLPPRAPSKQVNTDTKSESTGSVSGSGSVSDPLSDPLSQRLPPSLVDSVIKDLDAEKQKQIVVQQELDRLKKEQIERDIQSKKDEQANLDKIEADIIAQNKKAELEKAELEKAELEKAELNKIYTWFAIGGGILLLVILLIVIFLVWKKKEVPDMLEDYDDE